VEVIAVPTPREEGGKVMRLIVLWPGDSTLYAAKRGDSSSFEQSALP